MVKETMKKLSQFLFLQFISSNFLTRVTAKIEVDLIKFIRQKIIISILSKRFVSDDDKSVAATVGEIKEALKQKKLGNQNTGNKKGSTESVELFLYYLLNGCNLDFLKLNL